MGTRMFASPVAPEWATYTNDGRMDAFKVHKRLSDAKSAMTLHGVTDKPKIGIVLYHWENGRWDLKEVRGGADFSTPFHLGGKQGFLGTVHPMRYCEGRECTIHNPPSKLPDGWSFYWRTDRGIMERICLHGIGHPDPGQFTYWKENNMEFEAVHGCDGCCRLA